MKLNEKGMIIGMYFAKFEELALSELGFMNFNEAFNVIGLLTNIKSASLRNYRDEFSPAFPTRRQGWHKREMHSSRKEILLKFNCLDFNGFTNLVKNIFYENDTENQFIDDFEIQLENISLAKRLLTGQASENYFLENYYNIDFFNRGNITDTTKYGCGFDFKISFPDNSFYAIEVKGLNTKSGNILLTDKEYKVAEKLQNNYFIFIVRNFIEKPEHLIYRNPLGNNEINLKRQEQSIIQISYNFLI
ncbi:DUF3883 domain-containing protein [Candidatus Gracilibacteria bacterium]|nr:DUF3883 domain-containing protein [Candidatus Gracilibacteria bacterium]